MVFKDVLCRNFGKRTLVFQKLFLLIACLMMGSEECRAAQNDAQAHTRPGNVISAHLFGDAAIFSLQYEHLFLRQERFFFSAGAGLGYQEEFFLNNIWTGDPPEQFLSIPHHFSFNFGRSVTCLEIGFGGTVISGKQDQNYFVYPILGVRFQPLEYAGFSGRIYLEYPAYQAREQVNEILFIPFGLSLGYAF